MPKIKVLGLGELENLYFLLEIRFSCIPVGFFEEKHNFSKIKFHLQRPDHADRVERQKLDMRTGVEIAVGVWKVDLVKKQVLVRILAQMSYLKC